MGNGTSWALAIVGVIVTLAVIVYLGRPSAGAPGNGGAPPPAPVHGPSAAVSGSGISKSTSFRLAGNYLVSWTAQAESSVGCYHGASLERADGSHYFETIADSMINDAGRHTGTSSLYNVPDASYYVDASSGCSWSFTFTPQ